MSGCGLHPRLSGLFWLGWLLLLAGCAARPGPTPAPVLLTAAGSSSMTGLMTELAAAYSERHPHVSFDFQGGGSRLGQRQVEAGRVDLGLVAWPPEEVAPGFERIPLTEEPVAIVAHPDIELAGLSTAQLRDIFSGRLLNWRELDGPAQPIQVLSREAGSGARAAFETGVMDGQPVTPTAIVLPNGQAVLDFVAETPGAIGYASARLLDRPGLTLLAVDGYPPDHPAYPLRLEPSLLAAEERGPELDRFIQFVRSPAGQSIIQR